MAAYKYKYSTCTSVPAESCTVQKYGRSSTPIRQHASPRNRSHSYPPRPGVKRDMHASVLWRDNYAARSRVTPSRTTGTNAAVVEMAHGESPHGSERFTKELECTVMRKRTFAQAKGLVPVGSGTFFFLEQFVTQSIRTRIGISLLWLMHLGPTRAHFCCLIYIYISFDACIVDLAELWLRAVPGAEIGTLCETRTIYALTRRNRTILTKTKSTRRH